MKRGCKAFNRCVLAFILGFGGIGSVQAAPAKSPDKQAIAYAYMQQTLERCSQDAAAKLELVRETKGQAPFVVGLFFATLTAASIGVGGLFTKFFRSRSIGWSIPIAFVGTGIATYFYTDDTAIDTFDVSSVSGEPSKAYSECHGLFQVTVENGKVLLQEQDSSFGIRCLLDMEIDLAGLPKGTSPFQQSVSSVDSLEQTILPLPIRYETCELI